MSVLTSTPVSITNTNMNNNNTNTDDYTHLLQYNNYTAYLHTFITDTDLQYLPNEDLLLQLIELGYKTQNMTVLSRAEFTKQRTIAERNIHNRLHPSDNIQSQATCNIHIDTIDKTEQQLLYAIAERMDALRSNRLCTILYLRHYNNKQHEVSAYIDLASRLDTITVNTPIECSKSDLCYYNYSTNKCYIHNNNRFEVKTDVQHGLQIKNKFDRKIIALSAQCDQVTTVRTDIKDSRYLQCVLFDHTTRKNN